MRVQFSLRPDGVCRSSCVKVRTWRCTHVIPIRKATIVGRRLSGSCLRRLRGRAPWVHHSEPIAAAHSHRACTHLACVRQRPSSALSRQFALLTAAVSTSLCFGSSAPAKTTTTTPRRSPHARRSRTSCAPRRFDMPCFADACVRSGSACSPTSGV